MSSPARSPCVRTVCPTQPMSCCVSPVDHHHQQQQGYYSDYEQYQQHASSSGGGAAADLHHMAGPQDLLTGSSQQHQQELEQHHLLHSADHLAPLLLVTTVDIGDGKSDRIEVRQGDVPLEVANTFVTKHGLPTAVVPRLAMHLEENLLKVEAQRRAAVSRSM